MNEITTTIYTCIGYALGRTTRWIQGIGGKFWKDLRISTFCYDDAFGLVFFLLGWIILWYNISTKYLCNDGDLKRRGAPGTREQASRTDVDSKLVRTLICLHARMHGPETKCPFHFEMQAFLHAGKEVRFVIQFTRTQKWHLWIYKSQLEC